MVAYGVAQIIMLCHVSHHRNNALQTAEYQIAVTWDVVGSTVKPRHIFLALATIEEPVDVGEGELANQTFDQTMLHGIRVEGK